MDREFVCSDRDLYPVLKAATPDELSMLVEVMCKKMSCSIDASCRDPALIANEFQLMGGSTIANLTRGHGVEYREIVQDVASLLKVDMSSCSDISEMEWKITEYLLKKSLESMSEEERKRLGELFKKEYGYDIKDILDIANSEAGKRTLRRLILKIVVWAVLTSLGIRLAVRIVLSRSISILAGPIGIIIGAILVALDIQGPAYSVTVPGVLVMAMIRAEVAARDLKGN